MIIRPINSARATDGGGCEQDWPDSGLEAALSRYSSGNNRIHTLVAPDANGKRSFRGGIGSTAGRKKYWRDVGRCETVEQDGFVPRGVAAQQFHPAARTVQGFREQF